MTVKLSVCQDCNHYALTGTFTAGFGPERRQLCSHCRAKRQPDERALHIFHQLYLERAEDIRQGRMFDELPPSAKGTKGA
mgnify:CR=1 FL=1